MFGTQNCIVLYVPQRVSRGQQEVVMGHGCLQLVVVDSISENTLSKA